MNVPHRLAPALFFEGAQPGVQQIFDGDDAHQFSGLPVIDHR
jgi:hypothetical protein